MRATGFLRNVPVLAGLSDELLERLASQLQEVHVRAGQWIMREGDDADSMFIVESGRVDVIDEGPPERLIRALRRGDVLGELALLREGKRSASVRARRDADLLELGREPFEALIQEAPSFALGLVKAMGAQLAASRSPIVAATPPRTIVVLGLDPGAPVDQVAVGLTQALETHGRVSLLTQGELTTIDQAERANDRVVMQADGTPDQAWTDLAVREADLVVAVSTGSPSPAWRGVAAALRGCELLVYGAAVDT